MKRIFEPTQGSLLVSEPFLADSFFKRSVVLLSEHDKKGTLGFILNKPIISLEINIFHNLLYRVGLIPFPNNLVRH